MHEMVSAAASLILGVTLAVKNKMNQSGIFIVHSRETRNKRPVSSSK